MAKSEVRGANRVLLIKTRVWNRAVTNRAEYETFVSKLTINYLPGVNFMNRNNPGCG